MDERRKKRDDGHDYEVCSRVGGADVDKWRLCCEEQLDRGERSRLKKATERRMTHSFWCQSAPAPALRFKMVCQAEVLFLML